MKQKIKDICEKGSSNLKQKDLLSEGKYPVFGAGGLSGYLNTYHQEREYIGIVKDGSGIGRVDFYPAKTSLIGTMQYIIPLHGFNIRYIGYCLQSLDLSKHKQGAAIPHIYFKDYGEQEVNITSNIAEQEEIVSRLDKAFERIDTLRHNAEQSLTTAQQLFQSSLTNLLTPQPHWEIVSIGDIYKTYSGGTPLKTHQEYYINGKIPWLNSGEINKKYITKAESFITEDGMKNSSAKFFPINTILVAMYGATAAQVGILKFEATSNQAVCGLLPVEGLIPEFVYYWFIMNKNSFSSMAQGGAQPNLSQIKIKKMPLPLLPLSEQTAIVAKLDSLSAKVKQLKDNYTRTIALCDEMKQALLKEMFE